MPNGFGIAASSFVQGFRAGEQDVMSREQQQINVKAALQNMNIQASQNMRAQETHNVQMQQIQQQQQYIQQMENDLIRSNLQDSLSKFWENSGDVNALNKALQSPTMQNVLGTSRVDLLNPRDETDKGFVKQYLVDQGVNASEITPEVIDSVINSNVLVKSDKGEPIPVDGLTIMSGTYNYMSPLQRQNFTAVMAGVKELMVKPSEVGGVKGDIAQNLAGLMAMGIPGDQAMQVIQQIKGKLPSSDIQVYNQAISNISQREIEPTIENITKEVAAIKGVSPKAGVAPTPVAKTESYQEFRTRIGLEAPTGEQIMDTSKVSPEQSEILTTKAVEAFGDFSNTAKTDISTLLAHEKDFAAIEAEYDPSQTGLVNATWQSINAYLGLGKPSDIQASKAVGSAFTSAVASLRHSLYGATLTDKELSDANRQFGTLWQSDEATAQNFENVLSGYIQKLESVRADNKNVFDVKYGQNLIQLKKLQGAFIDAKKGRKPLSTTVVKKADITSARDDILSRLGE